MKAIIEAIKFAHEAIKVQCKAQIEFAEKVALLAGVQVRVPVKYGPDHIEYTHSPNKSIVPSNRKLRDLGWREIVPLEVGIRNTLDWMTGVLTLD